MSLNTIPKAWIVKIHPDKVPSNYFNIIPLSFPFSNQNLFKITFIPNHATFLTHFATDLWHPSIWQSV